MYKYNISRKEHDFSVKWKKKKKKKKDLKLKVGLSPSKKISVLKNDEKCFLFHLKNSFRSQDI